MKKNKGEKEFNPAKLGSPHIKKTKDSRIKLADVGSKSQAVFLNIQRDSYWKFRMDGGLVVNATCADWMLAKDDVGNVVVELKGSDVDHAIEQVFAATRYAKSNGLLAGGVAGLVICTQHPGIDTKIQRAKNKFAKDFQGPLHSKCGGGEFEFERVLSFDGPCGPAKK